MRSNKFILLIVAAVVSGAFCALSAMAEVNEPESYLRLTAFENFSPAQAPQLQGGQGVLSTSETRYKERLPVQLSGAIKRVHKTASRAPRKQDFRY